MQLTVKSYRGIDRAEIVIPENEITLLAAKNNRGKSSIVEALVCNIQANPYPLQLNKKDMHHVIHHGAKETEISLLTKHGKRTIVLPACEVKTSSGTGMNASNVALGELRLGELDKEKLANVLTKYLGVSLDRKRLETELGEITILDKHKLDDELKKNICDTVFGTEKLQPKGWDAGEKYAKEHATIRKTQFKTATNVTWGSSQGFTFIPTGWEPDLEKLDEKELQHAVTAAAQELERAIALNALSEAEAETLQAAVAKLDEHNKALHANNLVIDDLEKKIADASKRTQIAKCSSCGLTGHVIDGELIPADSEANVEDANEQLASWKSELATAKSDWATANAGIKAGTEAQQKLSKGSVSAESPVEPARTALAKAKARLEAKSTKVKGVDLHVQVLALIKAAELLGSDGLRMRVLVSQLEEFNKDLASLCSTAGWSQVQITRELGISYDNKPYVALSKSEKYKVDRTLQIALAVKEDAPIVVLDEADILDRDGRNQLFRLLIDRKLTAVVAMTIIVAKDGTRDVVDLSEKGYGVTYWVEDAKAVRLGTPQAVA